MAKKETKIDGTEVLQTSELAAVAAGEKEQPLDISIVEVPNYVHFRISETPCISSHTIIGAQEYSYRVPVEYPDNVTDQLHGASLAQLVKQGQGQIDQDANDFDYPDGKESKVHSLGLKDAEWSSPAERYEHEVSLNREIASGVAREMSEKRTASVADKAVPETVDKAASAAKSSAVEQSPSAVKTSETV